jgi:hypothetical protein
LNIQGINHVEKWVDTFIEYLEDTADGRFPTSEGYETIALLHQNSEVLKNFSDDENDHTTHGHQSAAEKLHCLFHSGISGICSTFQEQTPDSPHSSHSSSHHSVDHEGSTSTANHEPDDTPTTPALAQRMHHWLFDDYGCNGETVLKILTISAMVLTLGIGYFVPLVTLLAMDAYRESSAEV